MSRKRRYLKCPKCGKRISKMDKFCKNCGICLKKIKRPKEELKLPGRNFYLYLKREY